MDSGDVAHKVLRAFAITVGVLASVIGIFGVVLVLTGNQYLAGACLTVALIGLTVLAIGRAVLAWSRPIAAGLALVIASIGYWWSIGGVLGGWWSDYQDAIRTSGVADNAFWGDHGGAAVATFLVAAVLLLVAAVLAFLGHDWRVAPRRTLTST